MKYILMTLAIFISGCSQQKEKLNHCSELKAGLRNRFLREQVESFCKTYHPNRKKVIITVSIRNLDEANEFTISSSINNPSLLCCRIVAFDIISGYLVVFYNKNADMFINYSIDQELQNKIAEMDIQLNDKFMLYESKSYIVKMDIFNLKIIKIYYN